MGSNLPLTLLLVGGGAIVMYSAVTDQKGGPLGVIQRGLSGQAQGKAKPAATLESLVGGNFAMDAATDPTAGDFSTDPMTGASNLGQAVVDLARTFIGVPYKYAGNGPPPDGDGTFDCSGLAKYCLKHAAGVDIQRTTSLEQLQGTDVGGQANARAGDLVFYGTPAYHVGIVVGDGKTMIDAPHTGSSVGQRPYYNDISGFRRYV